jgi:Na+/H+ antiporter NhaD/arsenite permease-like protein
MPLRLFLILAFAFFSMPAMAAEGLGIDGSYLSLMWIIPFCGILLSIAILPLTFPHFWHQNFGKIAVFWALAFLVPFAVLSSAEQAAYEFVHIILTDYVPFVVILFALFTISGGIRVKGNLHGTPLTNTILIATGTLLASAIGTTGASMILIRPLLRANDNRSHRAHTVIFFIFLVSNIGGSLTPLGDPPLFLGFLRGVDFFWTFRHLALETLTLSVILLAAFFALDCYFYRREENLRPLPDPTPDSRIGLEGLRNIPLLGICILAILISAAWKPDVHISILGTRLELQNMVRDGLLILCAGVSLQITPSSLRQANEFNWEPVAEVIKLFFGIFVCLIPALAILKAGAGGAMSPLVALVTDEAGIPRDEMYFWLTGLLSGFLDNAPTYLVFFNLAGGDPQVLMNEMASTLQAISGGAVFMGALSYIGNAPNFMVRSIAEHQGVKMPSFFGYMLWSGTFLLPCFALLTFLFFL